MLVGDRWDAARSSATSRSARHRFERAAGELGVATNVLTGPAFGRLVAEGVLERARYQRAARAVRVPAHGEGAASSASTLLALMQCGRPPRLREAAAERRAGGADRSPVSVQLVAEDGSLVAPDDVRGRPRPRRTSPVTDSKPFAVVLVEIDQEENSWLTVLAQVLLIVLLVILLLYLL
jgi:hypothetical protein